MYKKARGLSKGQARRTSPLHATTAIDDQLAAVGLKRKAEGMWIGASGRRIVNEPLDQIGLMLDRGRRPRLAQMVPSNWLAVGRVHYETGARPAAGDPTQLLV